MNDDIRPGEIACALPDHFDAGLYFIGRIRTPWATRAECPRRGDPENGPLCRVEVDPRWREALAGLEGRQRLQILYFMHQARRDLILQTPRGRDAPLGTFALRSPVRPNPVASSVVRLEGTEAGALLVRGLDCLDGTPLVDIKPQD